MKILQVTPGYAPVIGGVERHVEALTQRLTARGHQVTVATMEPRGKQLGDAQHDGAEVLRFRAWGAGDAYRVPMGLGRFLRANRNRFDIVHVHNYHAPLIPLVASSGARPFVVTTHLNDAPHSGFARLLHYPYGLAGAAAVRRAATVICVTEAERGRVMKRLGVAEDRTVVIPNGFSPQLLEARNDDGERDRHLLLFVGRLQPYKRVDLAIRSLAALGAEYRLVVVGDGPERQALQELAAGLGVADRVTFAGRATDGGLIEWYRRAGIVLSLSSAEAFGMTVLEGVAAGAQVVSSDIPAFRDLGRAFPGQVTPTEADRPEKVAAAIERASGRVGEAPADVSAFTWDAVADRLLDVYWNVMEPARRTRMHQGEGLDAGRVEASRRREDGRKISSARTGAKQGGT